MSGRTSGCGGGTAASAAGFFSPSSAPSLPPSPLSLRGGRGGRGRARLATASTSAAGGPSNDPLSDAAKTVEAAAKAAADALTNGGEKQPKQKKKWSGLARRAGSGVALGAGAAATIAWGGWVLCAVACLVVYQASQEYYGLVTSQGE